MIERVASVTTAGAWRIENHGIVTDDESVAPFSVDGGYAMKEDLTWSVLMQPTVASPLVEWLRTAAFEFEEADGPADGAGEAVESFVGSSARAALRFARLVLGEPE